MTGWNINMPKRFSQLRKANRKGRNPYDGFVRGYGISKCNVENVYDANPVFICSISVL